MIQSRRTFLRQSAMVSLGFTFLARCTSYTGSSSPGHTRYPLVADPEAYMDLPEGFSYRIISRVGNPMADGFLVPGRPDGMGAFDLGEGRLALIRNHENSPSDLDISPFGKDNADLSKIDSLMLYDPGMRQQPGLGGTTTLIYNETTGKVEQEFLSLAGTYRNCAGGITPWGSWLTCEEDVTTAGELIEQDHGYVFEVFASDTPKLTLPVPIKAMGRFNHEAVAVDPRTGIVYQTEDRNDGLIYRFLPKEKGNLHAGGLLQVLSIVQGTSLDTRNWDREDMPMNLPMQVRWLNMEDVLAPEDDLRYRGFDQGAARFARGEGMWFGENELFFACTNGGPRKYGQVFKYTPSSAEGTPGELDQPGTLELYAQSGDKTVLHMCDNLTIAPWGHVILSEDNGERNHIRGINSRGEIYDLACNRSSSSEFAGTVFSPSGNTLFVNIQENGDTLAITGPWEKLA